MKFEYEIATGDVLRVVITGRLTSSDVLDVRGMLNRVEAAADRAVELDLSGLQFLDSVGLGFLVHLRSRVRAKGHGFALGAVSAQIQRTLEMTGLEKFLST